MRCKFQWLVNINEKNSGLTVIECMKNHSDEKCKERWNRYEKMMCQCVFGESKNWTLKLMDLYYFEWRYFYEKCTCEIS